MVGPVLHTEDDGWRVRPVLEDLAGDTVAHRLIRAVVEGAQAGERLSKLALLPRGSKETVWGQGSFRSGGAELWGKCVWGSVEAAQPGWCQCGWAIAELGCQGAYRLCSGLEASS